MTTKNKRGVTGALLLVSVTEAGLAQAPTFRTGTTLVEFTVVALDGRGNPVTELAQAELTLTDRGQSREIAFFRFDGDEKATDASVPPPALSPGFVSNRPEYQPEPQRNVTAVVLDLVNTAAPDQNRARAQMLRHLKVLPNNTPVGLFQFTETQRVTVLVPFTTKVELLRAQMSASASLRRELVRPGHQGRPIVGGECGAAEGGGPVPNAGTPGQASRGSASMAEGMAAMSASEAQMLSGVNQTIRTVRLDTTLANLEAIGNHLAAIPGRKNVVWISSGMPIQLKALIPRNYEPEIRLAAQRLADQGVVIYPVDAKGNCRPLDTSSDEGPYGLSDATQQVLSSLNVVADVTGGRVTKYDDDLSKGVTAAANDVRGSYTIGFYTADEPDDRWHAIQVATKRRGVVLRHRQGYHSAARAQPQSSYCRSVDSACDGAARIERRQAERPPDGSAAAGHGPAADRCGRSVFPPRAERLPRTWRYA